MQSVSLPAVSGFVHNVYIVETSDGKYICRFSDKNTASYNTQTSKLLLSHGINVPDISMHKIQDLYCETYRFINGKTLYERLIEGMSQENKEKVYKQVFDILCKINKIKSNIKVKPSIYTCLRLVENMFALLNPQEKKVLCHNDLHARNIILDQNDNLYALIDVDSIYYCEPSFAFMTILSHAKLYGYQSDTLIKLYNQLYPYKRIISMKKQVNAYSYLLWFYKNIIHKHILNFRYK